MPLLAAFGGSSWLKDWPPYAAYLAFELYQRNELNTDEHTENQDRAKHTISTSNTEKKNHQNLSFFVRVVYQGTPLTLPGCDPGIYIYIYAIVYH